MYISQINSTTNFGCAQMLTKTPKLMNRSLLQKTSNLKNLHGPKEIKEAKKMIAIYSGINATTGAIGAQACGAEEIALGANEVTMAMAIINGVYDFSFSKGVIKSILTGIIGNRVGTYVFKGASKFVTWVPFLGNGLNAIIAGVTTAGLGADIIRWCEEKDKERKRNKRIDDILNGK